jgi:RNA polymerase sigma-70 factor (ECF subfamily)
VTADDLAGEFEEFRPRLLGIAYRLLGSMWDAEDVVADAMVRWMRVERSAIEKPVAYLTTVVTRLALDELRSARVRRERYVGEWLPEPVMTDPSPLGPLDTVERREAVSLATMRMAETLTPPQRAVLVLHEAFDLTHAEIAGVLEITEDGSRQHLRRARDQLRNQTPRPQPTVHDDTLARFLAALEDGDLDQVQELLAADVVSYSDGGGKARAASHPIVGADDVARFLGALRQRLTVREVRTLEVNGATGATLRFGRQFALLAVDVGGSGIRELQWIMNPDKLRYLRRQLDGDPPHTGPQCTGVPGG